MLVHLIEEILPLDYFTTLLGVSSDHRIFRDLLKAHNNNVFQKLEEL